MRFPLLVVALSGLLLACSSEDGRPDTEGMGSSGTEPSTGGSVSSGGASTGGTAESGGAPSGDGSASGGEPSGGSSGGEATCQPNVGCQLDPPPSTGDPRQDCVDRINQFRTQCLCLPELARWDEGEDCADQHAEYDSTRTPHAGFSDRICEDGGWAQNECPGWRSEEHVIRGCLQAMWDEGPPPTEPCNDQCFQDHGHFINMSSDRYDRVACGFYTNPQGEVWAVQNFSN